MIKISHRYEVILALCLGVSSSFGMEKRDESSPDSPHTPLSSLSSRASSVNKEASAGHGGWWMRVVCGGLGGGGLTALPVVMVGFSNPITLVAIAAGAVVGSLIGAGTAPSMPKPEGGGKKYDPDAGMFYMGKSARQVAAEREEHEEWQLAAARQYPQGRKKKNDPPPTGSTPISLGGIRV